MINDFIIQALPEQNILVIILNGFFMKSEIELAIYLIRIESQKLKPGFDVMLSIKNLRVAKKEFNLSFRKMKNILKLFGANNMHLLETDTVFAEAEHDTVGLYPYENEWFF